MYFICKNFQKRPILLFVVAAIAIFIALHPNQSVAYSGEKNSEPSYSRFLIASVASLFKDIVGWGSKNADEQNKGKGKGNIIYSYDKKELEEIIGKEKQKLKEEVNVYRKETEEALEIANEAKNKYEQLKNDFDQVKVSETKNYDDRDLRSEILNVKKETEKLIKNIYSPENKNNIDDKENDATDITALRSEIQNINTNLLNQISNLSSQTSNQTSAVYRAVSLTNKIDNLSGVTISNATVSGIAGLTDADIPDTITASNYLPLSGGTVSGTLTVNANILQQASSYLNFGTTEGFSGYGFRDSGGKMQIKNSGGSWVNLSTASTTIVNQYATSGSGTEAEPWIGWENSINNLAQNSDIFFPAGYYSLSSPIIAKAGWRMSGAGVDSTRITLANGTDDSILKSASDPTTGSYVWNLTIQDLYLDGNKDNNSSGKGVYGSFWHLKIYRTKFKNFAENGINLIAGGAGEIWENFLIDVYVEASDGDNVKIESGVNDGEIIRLVSRDSGENGIHLNSVGGWKITNSHFYYNQVGVRFKDSSKTTLNNSEIETNKTIGLQVNGSGGNQIVGNSFYRNSCPTIASNVCSGYGSYSHVTIEWSNNNGIVGNNFYKYGAEPNFTKYIVEEQGTSDSNYVSDNSYVGYATGDFLKVGENTIFTSNYNGETNSLRGIFTDMGIGTTSPQRKLHVYRSDDGAPVRFEDSNGYCEIDPTSTSWTCTSDRTLKKDISNLASENSLSKLSQLQAVNFKWLNQNTDDLRYGLIAQDVENVFPDFVQTDERGIKTVNYGGFTPIIIDAIKELNLKINNSSSNSNEICVGETCVTEEQFKAVFGNSSSSSSSSSATPEVLPYSSAEETGSSSSTTEVTSSSPSSESSSETSLSAEEAGSSSESSSLPLPPESITESEETESPQESDSI